MSWDGDLITQEQAEHWAGRPLSDEDMERLQEAIPFSTVVDAISAIVDSFDTDPDDFQHE